MGKQDRGKAGDERLNGRIRNSGEPLASYVAAVGFPAAVTALVHSVRPQIERFPETYRTLGAAGVRDEGALWFVGESADDRRSEVGYDLEGTPQSTAACVCARVFCRIACRHPYFDGNKRTAFLPACIVGFAMGLEIRPVPYAHLEEEVRQLTAAEESEDAVARWFLTKVFIPAGGRMG